MNNTRDSNKNNKRNNTNDTKSNNNENNDTTKSLPVESKLNNVKLNNTVHKSGNNDIIIRDNNNSLTIIFLRILMLMKSTILMETL